MGLAFPCGSSSQSNTMFNFDYHVPSPRQKTPRAKCEYNLCPNASPLSEEIPASAFFLSKRNRRNLPHLLYLRSRLDMPPRHLSTSFDLTPKAATNPLFPQPMPGSATHDRDENRCDLEHQNTSPLGAPSSVAGRAAPLLVRASDGKALLPALILAPCGRRAKESARDSPASMSGSATACYSFAVP